MKKIIYILLILSITLITLNAQYKKGYSLLEMPQRLQDWYKYDYQSFLLGENYYAVLKPEPNDKKSIGVLCLIDFLKDGEYKNVAQKENKPAAKQIKESVRIRQLEMKVTPNPISTDINVSLYMPEAGNVKLEVFNMLGKKALELSDNQYLEAGDHKLSFNRGSIPTGAYYLKLYANNEQSVQMIVFE
jgi:hypothetical protein